MNIPSRHSATLDRASRSTFYLFIEMNCVETVQAALVPVLHKLPLTPTGRRYPWLPRADPIGYACASSRTTQS